MRLVIDISGLAYRSAYKLKLSDRKGVPTNVVFGTLRSIEHLVDMIDPEEAIICWDEGHEARSRLYPEYKANRKKDPEFQADFKRQMGVLREVLECLPIVNVSEHGVEADDCIAALTEFMKPELLGIVTGDQDLYQLASGPAHVVSSSQWKGSRHIIMDYDGVPVRLQFKPSQYITYKVLVGDSSDNVKGVLGLGDKTARRLLEECGGTLKQIMKAAEVAEKATGSGKKILGRMTYSEALPIVKRNLKLIKLQGTPLLTTEQRTRIIAGYRQARLHRQLQKEKLRGMLTSLGFKSILRRFSRFTTTFAGMVRIPRHVAEAEVEHGEAQEVHQADQESPRMWRRIRKIARKGDHRDRERTTQTNYIRRVRKVKDAHAPTKRRWRRVRRVVGAARGAAGVERGDQDEGEGDPAAVLSRGAREPTELDPCSGHESAGGAVSSVVLKARASRDRRRAEELSHVPEVLQPERVRRDRALSVLSSINRVITDGGTSTADDVAWLKQQSDADLKRLVQIIRWFERDPDYTPSEEDAEFLDELEYRRSMELPEWMMTEGEKEEREESIAVSEAGYWDFASNAIAGMGRRNR